VYNLSITIFVKGVEKLAFVISECLLLDLLKKKNMSQAEFARKLGVSRQFVHDLIILKKFMSYEFAVNASFILDCEMHSLYKTTFVKQQE
jgi:transcriptional regulator with XRE-family HTH domain